MQSITKTEGVDAKAAAVILQRYLDRKEKAA
jgi:RNase H-fold protein (predicted Holliday junction resolvase)